MASNKEKTAPKTSPVSPENLFDSNIHLKNNNSPNIYVNTDALDLRPYSYKFNNIQKNSENPRYVQKSRFNWQIDEYEIS